MLSLSLILKVRRKVRILNSPLRLVMVPRRIRMLTLTPSVLIILAVMALLSAGRLFLPVSRIRVV
uniref:Uncharacterized protein n=1 Tax=Podoviridae sp. ct2iq11 TaxID=2827720 RepID=A0A8S5TPM0_9CAUD|nr:MAG TPA: hypothetical protein [Podoviridae sp. ct2iq11]